MLYNARVTTDFHSSSGESARYSGLQILITMTQNSLNTDHVLSATTTSECSIHLDDLRNFAARLRSISERARKLLVHIAEMAYHGRGQDRRTDVAYLPELYESTGLDVESMYALLKELQAAQFVVVEDQYPFEDVKILSCGSGWNALAAISSLAEAKRIPLRDVIADVHFELLQ
ncbi:MAG: hypothetical protein DMG62_16255 [Acidobacteria bacterium]|nr:MAG: hypothetical protein DMG63_13340 [Acidobacteriota bacterium]PYY21944.1 MAG: hypothetical protein DMG62_16255 [Acidobacteriota bacterium]